MIRTMSAYVNQERKSRTIQFATGATIESDCDAIERVCASEALGLFRAFINGSIKLEQDKSAINNNNSLIYKAELQRDDTHFKNR